MFIVVTYWMRLRRFIQLWERASSHFPVYFNSIGIPSNALLYQRNFLKTGVTYYYCFMVNIVLSLERCYAGRALACFFYKSIENSRPHHRKCLQTCINEFFRSHIKKNCFVGGGGAMAFGEISVRQRDYVWNRVYLTCENNRFVEFLADVCWNLC